MPDQDPYDELKRGEELKREHDAILSSLPEDPLAHSPQQQDMDIPVRQEHSTPTRLPIPEPDEYDPRPHQNAIPDTERQPLPEPPRQVLAQPPRIPQGPVVLPPVPERVSPSAATPPAGQHKKLDIPDTPTTGGVTSPVPEHVIPSATTPPAGQHQKLDILDTSSTAPARSPGSSGSTGTTGRVLDIPVTSTPFSDPVDPGWSKETARNIDLSDGRSPQMPEHSEPMQPMDLGELENSLRRYNEQLMNILRVVQKIVLEGVSDMDSIMRRFDRGV